MPILSLFAALSLQLTPITLVEVRKESRQNTAALLSELDLQQAQTQGTNARSMILPRLSLFAAFGSAYESRQRFFGLVDPGNTGVYTLQSTDIPATSRGIFGVGATFSQLLLDGGGWWNNISRFNRLQDAAEQRLDEQKNSSELEGIQRFYELYLAEKQYEVLQETFKRSKEQEARALAIFQAGRAGKSEHFSAQVNTGNDEVLAIRHETALARTRARLGAWLMRAADVALTARVPANFQEGSVSPVPSVESSIRVARTHRPALTALEKEAEAAEKAVAVAWSAYLPALRGELRYAREGPTLDPVFTNLSFQNAFSGQIILQWDLFSGFQTHAAVRNAQAMAQKARLSLNQSLRELELEVRQRTVEVQTMVRALEVTRNNRTIAQQSFKLAEQRFQAGVGSTLEVRDAQLKLKQAELSVLENRVEVEIAWSRLRYTIGDLQGFQN
jgi:outer membrane protein